MALKIWLDVQAERDLHSIREYLVEHASAAMAERVRKHLKARIDHLRHSPAIGIATNEPDIRVLPPTRYPFRIFYTVTGEAVIILHIRHSARSEPDLKDFGA